MKYFKFIYHLAFVIISYNAYGTLLETDTANGNQTSMLNSFSIPPEMPPDEVIKLLTHSDGPEQVVLDGQVYTPNEYYTMVGANNAQTGLGHSYKIELEKCRRQLERLVDKHFKQEQDTSYSFNNIPISSGFDEFFIEKVERLIQIFPDQSLKFQLGLVLSQSDQQNAGLRALEIFANVICSNYLEGKTISIPEIKEYLCTLSYIKNKKMNLKPIVDNVLLLIQNPDKYITKNQIKGTAKKKNLILNKVFLDYCGSLFSEISHFPKSSCALFSEATFLSIRALLSFKLDTGHPLEQAFCIKFFETVSLENRTPSMKIVYAEHLTILGKYSEAIDCMKSVLGTKDDPNNPWQTARNYNKLASCLFSTKDYPQMRQICERELELEDTVLARWNVAFANIKCENYDDKLLKILKEINDLPSSEKKKHQINPMIASCSYQYALEKAGKTEELTQFLLAKQAKVLEKALNKDRKQGQIVKAAIAKKKKLDQQRKINVSAKQPSPTYSTSSTTATSTTSTTSTTSFSDTHNQKEKYIAPEVKVKKKTRGIAKNSPILEEKPQEDSKPLIYIETLTDNKNARETFNKLFTFHQKKNCFDNEIQISLREINSLFKALKQKIDPIQGKGSHKKVTLNLHEAGSEMEEQMIILTNTIYLKEYQIKQIREHFARARVVPSDPDVHARLHEDGFLD